MMPAPVIRSDLHQFRARDFDRLDFVVATALSGTKEAWRQVCAKFAAAKERGEIAYRPDPDAPHGLFGIVVWRP